MSLKLVICCLTCKLVAIRVQLLALLLICSIRLVVQRAKVASCDAQGNPCCWPFSDRMKPDTDTQIIMSVREKRGKMETRLLMGNTREEGWWGNYGNEEDGLRGKWRIKDSYFWRGMRETVGKPWRQEENNLLKWYKMITHDNKIGQTK